MTVMSLSYEGSRGGNANATTGILSSNSARNGEGFADESNFLRGIVWDEWISLTTDEMYKKIRHGILQQASNAVSMPSLLSTDQGILTAQQRKNQAVIALLDEWLADTSGYDEKVWPLLKQTIEENRLSERRRFND